MNCMKIFASTLLAMGVVNSAALESSPNTQENDEQLAQTSTEYIGLKDDSTPIDFSNMFGMSAAVVKADVVKVDTANAAAKAVAIVKVDNTADKAAKAAAAKAEKAAALAKK